MFTELAYLSIQNQLRARARLIMTAGGVMIGTTAVILLIALTIGLQDAAESSIGDSASLTQITIRASFRRNSSGPTLDDDAVTAIKAMDGVAAVVPVLSLSGQIELRVGDLRGSGQVYGIYPDTVTSLGADAEQGTLALDTNDIYGAVVGASVATNFSDPDSTTTTTSTSSTRSTSSSSSSTSAVTVDLINNTVELRVYSQQGKFRKINLNVNGVMESGTSNDFAIYLPIQTVIDLNKRIYGVSSDDITYSQIIVQATSRETVATLMTALQELGYNATGMGSYLSQLNGFFSILRLMLGSVGGIALLVAAFGVANTMTMAILERTREIGLMKAVGATDGNVMTIFLIEAGLVGLLGGVTGLGISYLAQYVVNTVMAASSSGGSVKILNLSISGFNGSLIAIPPELSVFALVLATTIGIGAGLYPAMRAAHLTTVIALKTD